jgi:hypothetical protein
MRLREYKPPLIHTRRGAITAVCLTGFLFVTSIRALFLYTRHGGRPQFQWPLTFQSLPSWFEIIANVALYAYILWLGAVFYRIARGGERIVVVGWLANFLIGPLKMVFSPAGAFAIRYVQTGAMAVAFLAALVLVRKPYGEPEDGDTKTLKRGLFVFSVLVIVMLLIGALIYLVA